MIGVFDSGIGGLSILKALRRQLPQHDFIYLADSGNAPYGERTAEFVIERSLAITTQLLAKKIQLLVIACNTATAAAAAHIRAAYPLLPIVGVEPALKPAIGLTKTGRIGVIATRRTVNSEKFQTLLAAQQRFAEFVVQPCDGLAGAIESNDTTKTIALCRYYTSSMGQFGVETDQIDTLVLGCTHYSFAKEVLAQLVGPNVVLIDTAAAIARQAQRLLENLPATGSGRIELISTGDLSALQAAAKRWL